MKIKIDESGALYIERAGKMRKQYCPYTGAATLPRFCGDWCPLFKEYSLDFGENGLLMLCNNNCISVNSCIDERKAE